MAPMAATRPADVPAPAPPAVMGELRAALARAGYTAENVAAVLHLTGELTLGPADLQVHDLRTRDGTPLSTVVRLLALGFEVDEQAVASALAPAKLAGLVEVGLLEVGGGKVRALVRLMAHGEILIACDLPRAGGANHVTGLNGPAGLLAGLAVRRPCNKMLDLGTGNGIQGLLAARHCEHVISTDINPRAIAYAEFNAALNGITNLETRLGSLYEPVRDERFGLILSNPPYVISPESSLVYRDSGLGPGEICRQVLLGAGPHLDENGYAQALVSWPMADGRPWDEELRTWVPPEVDAWLLHYQTEDPLTHAASWNRLGLDASLSERGRALDEWLGYDQREGIDAIGFGAVFLHRRTPGGRVFTSEARSGVSGASRQAQRVFASMAVGELTDEDARTTTFIPVPELEVEQVVRAAPGGWLVDRCSVRLTEGVGYNWAIDPTLAAVLLGLDSRLTVDGAVTAASNQAGVDVDALRGPALSLVRHLYELGFLVRPEDPPALG
jgi:hypothetical protein